MDAFARAMDKVEQYEGGWSDHAADPGGATKWGVTIKTIMGRQLDFNRDGRVDLSDLKDMTRDQARELYRRDYWNACGADQMPAPLALIVFNSAVNQGVSRASKFLQKAVGANQDGIVGPKTIAAVLSAWDHDPAQVVVEFLLWQSLHYAGLGTFQHFGKGWMRRTFDVAWTAATWHFAAGGAVAPPAPPPVPVRDADLDRVRTACQLITDTLEQIRQRAG
jgi:lysozyme family protein